MILLPPWHARSLAVALTALSAAPQRLPGQSAVSPAAEPSRPPPLHWEAVAYDSDRARLVLFGGSTIAPVAEMGDTWEWDGGRWHLTVPAASGPGPRRAHGMAYHPAERRLFLAGGVGTATDGRDIQHCDTWLYDGRRWARAADGPCGDGASLVYDSARQAMLWIEGPQLPFSSATRGQPLRIWRWTRNAWVLADSSGPRFAQRARPAFDAARSVLVVLVFEGPDAGVWEWDARRWRHVDGAGPSPRNLPGFAYDPRLRRTVMAGGRRLADRAFLADVWAWDGGRWTELGASGETLPSARSHATLVTDAASERLLYYGGTAGGVLFRELWQFDRQGWRLTGDPSPP